MEIFQESRLIISHAGLASSNFVRIGGITIPRVFIRATILTAFVLGIIIMCFICMHNCERGIAKMLLPFGGLLTLINLIFTYSTLIRKTDKITRLMDYMQHMINQSNKLSHLN